MATVAQIQCLVEVTQQNLQTDNVRSIIDVYEDLFSFSKS